MLIPVCPADPETLKALLSVLGKPSYAEVKVFVGGDKLKALGIEGSSHGVVEYRASPDPGEVVRLYEEFYNGYIKHVGQGHPRAEGSVVSIDIVWIYDDARIEFDEIGRAHV